MKTLIKLANSNRKSYKLHGKNSILDTLDDETLSLDLPLLMDAGDIHYLEDEDFSIKMEADYVYQH